ncbi:hypothetical protein T05_14751 [Trichinella murrelli]|uniref:Uncharacterized protein n=1 Tax=Trichinella murrelli TaxID=144512 RepID=A0A0V0TG40_9BILA|nr:hypothetical protein T05_14751 [Trichinella murrelli]
MHPIFFPAIMIIIQKYCRNNKWAIEAGKLCMTKTWTAGSFQSHTLALLRKRHLGLGIECHFVDKKFSVLTFEHRYYDIKKKFFITAQLK